jgi:hypothetical protein
MADINQHLYFGAGAQRALVFVGFPNQNWGLDYHAF